MFHVHPTGSECLSSTCGSLRHSGGSSEGEIQRECFHLMAPAVNSAAALPQGGTHLICVRASPAPAHQEFGKFIITNSLFFPPAGGSHSVPTAFENEYSNFSNTVWKTNGLVFLYQLIPFQRPTCPPLGSTSSSSCRTQGSEDCALLQSYLTAFCRQESTLNVNQTALKQRK